MFDKNPTNEFFVEESFPLEWMYPHLTPFGVIMKINREPLPALTEDILQCDHAFWAKYSERLIGNWITYDTTIKEVASFVEKTYLRHDYKGFTGDLKFVRDDQGQKAFSKLRSSIAGVYAWRLGLSGNAPTPPEYQPRSQAERDRLFKEADFAFKQAFAFCPYSPEAVFRYLQILMANNRLDDAIIVLETAHKLDPYNDQVEKTLKQLQGYKTGPNKLAEIQATIAKLQEDLKRNPDDFQTALNLASTLFGINQTAAGVSILDDILKHPRVTPEAVIAVAQYYMQNQNLPKLETVLQRLCELQPNIPEPWYDLAALRCLLGKTSEGVITLKRAIELSDARLKKDPKAHDMRAEALKDQRFQAVSQSADFKSIVTQH
jgi:tetratricopeptide (TPR) repeat protein